MWQRALHNKRIVGLFTILVILAAVPLTIQLAQTEQDIRQQAAESNAPVCSETGTDTILIIDKSNSMNNPSSSTDPVSRFTRAKQAAKNFADILAQKNASLPEEKKHKLAVVSFSDSTHTNQDTVLTTDMSLVKSRIDAIQPGDDQTGWTCIECGVKKANAEFASTRQRSNLNNFAVLLTDGKANWLEGGTASVAQATAEQKALEAVMSGFTNQQISYFTIGLGAKQEISEAFLQKVASQTNAKYYYAPTATELQGIYSQISQVLGKGTVSGFVYQDSNANASFDTGEQKLSGWNLQLTQNSTTISSGTTDTNGNYTFTNICDGTYSVKLSLPTGWNQTSPSGGNSLSVTLSNGAALTNKNFGVKQEPLRTTLTCSPATLHLDEAGQLITATLKDSTGAPLSDKPIQWGANSSFIFIGDGPSLTTSQGMTSKTVRAENAEAAFSGKVTATFPGDANNAASSCEVTTQFTPKSTTLSLSLFLDGIGNAGDNANPNDSSLSNKNPKRQSRPVTISIYSDNNDLVNVTTQNENFNTSTGSFSVVRNTGASFPTGKYSVLISSPGYLTRKVPRIVTITNGGDSNLGKVPLVAGDVDEDNSLSILDYDLIIGCYTDYAPPVSCTNEDKNITDLNDDGVVNQFDYNLFLRELSVQYGDAIATQP